MSGSSTSPMPLETLAETSSPIPTSSVSAANSSSKAPPSLDSPQSNQPHLRQSRWLTHQSRQPHLGSGSFWISTPIAMSGSSYLPMPPRRLPKPLPIPTSSVSAANSSSEASPSLARLPQSNQPHLRQSRWLTHHLRQPHLSARQLL